MAQVAVDTELATLFAQAGAESAPAYERIKRMVVARIEAGHWTEGDLLPSESQLVAALKLSRMTVNRALRELAAEGVVQRLMGVGTFVAPAKKPSALFEVKNIADEVQQRGHRHRTEVILLRREQTDPVTTPLLREMVQDTVFHSLLVHFEDDVPIQVEDRFVAPAVAPGYLEQDFTKRTPNSYLSEVAPLVRGEHVVEAVHGSPEECRLLHIARDEPCLLIRRRTWAASGLVSAARLVHPGSRNRLEGTFTP
ncbi:histidine utilization repressor [Nocardia uniformis]|uniref:Histidine utilization repressor n=1 Tax=Nocardia uniformis TaxID=53432 RepID=A0A849CG94_9NOCA|nr:histidine utilization repressor [Nocardia uniformis]NNH75960.1 histidine utilization repressor [Nocardia uniformis]